MIQIQTENVKFDQLRKRRKNQIKPLESENRFFEFKIRKKTFSEKKVKSNTPQKDVRLPIGFHQSDVASYDQREETCEQTTTLHRLFYIFSRRVRLYFSIEKNIKLNIFLNSAGNIIISN